MNLELLELVDLTPNEYCIIKCIEEKQNLPRWNTLQPELRKLKSEKWVKETKDGLINTQKAIELLEKFKNDSPVISKNMSSKSKKDYINEYNELFPNIIFPSKVTARAPMSSLEPRFKWFFENHSFSWEVILEVTAKYLEEKQYVAWDKAICAKYFVKKTKDGVSESVLAELCNLYVNGDTNHQLSIFRDNTF